MDPFTLAALAGSAGKIFGGITSLFGGFSKAQAYRNAATQADAEAGVQAGQALAQGDEAAARGATQSAANGGGFVGSAIDQIAMLSQRSLFNARAAVYRGNTQAQSDLYNAKVAKMQGIQDMIGSLAGAGAQAAGGMGQSAQASAQMKALGQLRGLGGADSELAGLF